MMVKDSKRDNQRKKGSIEKHGFNHLVGREMQSAMMTRKDPRFTKILKVKIDIQGRCAWGVLQNLSLSGLYFKANCALEKGEAIAIQLYFPNMTTSYIKGLVRRIEECTDGSWKFGIGIELVEDDSHYRCYIQQLTEQNEMLNQASACRQ